ncbi:MAG: TIGR02147 family protein [bacterium]|nr:TIGR02147 family protein [bacterium]
MKPKPNIFLYDDYRSYIKDWFAWKKGSDQGYSYREFSKQAGFKSPNQLLLVIQNKRGISQNSLKEYVKVLGLKHAEKKYFQLLVDFSQEKNLTKKKNFFKEVSDYRKKKGHHLQAKEYEYLTNWYYAAIRELVMLKDFQEDPTWIAKKLHGLVTAAQAHQAIETLLEIKLLERDNSGNLCHTDQYITTGNETQEVAAFLYHEQMSQITLEALKSKDTSRRNITALTFSVRKEDYDSIVGELNKLRKRIINFVQHRLVQDEDDMLYQLNLQFVPLSVPPKE